MKWQDKDRIMQEFLSFSVLFLIVWYTCTKFSGDFRYGGGGKDENRKIYAGCEDIEDFFPILERDWKASHTMFIGVQNYDLRREHPDIDPTVCLYFARLLADVGKYFERGNVEFAKEY